MHLNGANFMPWSTTKSQTKIFTRRM